MYIQNGSDCTLMLPGGVSLEMVWVAPGSFMMGSEYEYGTFQHQSTPVHKVTLTKGYWIGKYQVTQEQWNAIGAYKKEDCHWNDRRLPVENVSWNDAVNCCACLNNKLNINSLINGYYFGLPTEAQWEFAARGGVKSEGYEYSGGYSINDVAWCNNYSETHEVGQKKPNELGIYDMSGNVAEWCQDWFGSYPAKEVTDPQGPVAGNERVYRGGGWFYTTAGCRVDRRWSAGPWTWTNDLGFRLALIPVQ